MTSITRSCQAPAATMEALVELADIAGVKVEFGISDKVQVMVTSSNKFTGIESSTPHFGYVGVARHVSTSIPESGLWGMSVEDSTRVEGWIQAASDTLVPILVSAGGDKKDVLDFANSIESLLFEKDQTYLVGDFATAADVVCAIWLDAACGACGVSEVPQQTHRWLATTLGSLKRECSVKEGTASPTEKAAPVKPPAAAPAAGPARKQKETAPAKKTKEAAPTPAPAAAPPTGDLADNAIVKKLVEFGIDAKTYSHVLCMTADELVKNVKVPEGESHTKNLFFKDKKHGLFLVTVKPESDVNTKALGKALNLEGKVNLRLATAELLMECLGVAPGCVGPLSVINDKENKVTLVLDQALLNVSKIHSHPLRNDASTVLTPDQLMEYLKKANHEPTVLEFGAAAAAAPKDDEKWAGKAPASRPPEDKKAPAKPPKKVQPAPSNKKSTKKGETLLALQWKKEENFPMWYSDVIVLSEMISYYDISGCYILRPWSYKIWELIQEWFNVKIRDLEVENSYFPLFVSQDRLEKEKDHVEGFAPEVAWVTKSGEGTLAKPIAVRPTSETIMYPAFSDWIKSHRDLPLKLNQWSNVVRWEFKDPTPFLRSREFLWQEGHTAHVSHDDADVMVMQALELYRGVYEDLLGVPVIKGYKTEKEKFAGGHKTTTVEAYIPMSGRAIQGATSHNLGQNFGKMFDISFQDAAGKTQIAWQTSWGLTTRTIGVMIMVHGDDTGLVLPPRIAPLQVVIVPIVSKRLLLEDAAPYCEAILNDLKAAGVRAKFDDRSMYNPGWKYNHWEQKGVPIRIEVGPRDMEQKQARVVVRYNGDKIDMPVEGLGSILATKLEDIHTAMFVKAKETRDQHLVQVTDWKDFVPNLELNNLVLTPWCGGEHQDWEEWVKEKSREESLAARGEEGEDDRTATSVAAKTLCIPFDQPELPEGTKCIASKLPATCWVLWGRSY